MFGLSRKTEYAVMALARLAEAHAADRGPISARTLAEADGQPAALLSSVLKQLHQAELLDSKRGVHGGYVLPAGPETIRLAEVIAAIEGPEPVRLTACCEQDEPARADAHDPLGHGHGHPTRSEPDTEDGCPIMCRCPITGAIRGLNRRMHEFLQQLTLADLLAEVGDAKLEM